GERLQNKNLDQAAEAAAGLGGLSQPLQQRNRRGGSVRCQQQAGQRDVFELAQIGEVIGGVDCSVGLPAPRLCEPALPDEDACLHRCQRPYLGEEVGDVGVLRLVEEVERAFEVTCSFA